LSNPRVPRGFKTETGGRETGWDNVGSKGGCKRTCKEECVGGKQVGVIKTDTQRGTKQSRAQTGVSFGKEERKGKTKKMVGEFLRFKDSSVWGCNMGLGAVQLRS